MARLRLDQLIRKKAKSSGYTEREVYHTDAGFSWDQLIHSANSFSLFSEKKLIEIRVHNGKPGDAGSKAIVEFCSNLSEDTTLLLVMPKLEKSSQSSKWFKALESNGQVVQIWPVGINELPRWVDQRLKAAGLQANTEAIEILCTKVEGNLLAASQEIEKLKLIAGAQVIDADIMSDCVMESARYDIFGLVDRALSGDVSAVITTLQGLRGEGSEPPVILWALAREIRTLAAMQSSMEAGQAFDLAARNNRVWDKRKPLFKQALSRLKGRDISQLFQLCSATDASIKGASKHDAWQLLQDISLTLCGKPALNSRSQAQALRS